MIRGEAVVMGVNDNRIVLSCRNDKDEKEMNILHEDVL